MLIKGLYKGAKNTKTSLGICSRTNDIVEPMIKSPQWFVNCNTMAKVALDAVRSKRIEIIPPQYEQDWYRYIYPLLHTCYIFVTSFKKSCHLSNQWNKQKTNDRTIACVIADGLKIYVIGVFQGNIGGDTVYLHGMWH